jgi:hypothetical protein
VGTLWRRHENMVIDILRDEQRHLFESFLREYAAEGLAK